MFADLTKSRSVYLAVILSLLAVGFTAWQTPNSSRQQFGTGPESGRSAHSDPFGPMNESLANDRKLLADYEQEQSKLRLEVINRRKLYQEGRIPKDQVHEVEKLFIAALKRVHEMRHTVLETDIAITEAVFGEKVERMPVPPVNGYSENQRFGALQWRFKVVIKRSTADRAILFSNLRPALTRDRDGPVADPQPIAL